MSFGGYFFGNGKNEVHLWIITHWRREEKQREMKNWFWLSLRVVGTRIQRKVALKSMANHRCSHCGLLNRSNVSNNNVKAGHIFSIRDPNFEGKSKNGCKHILVFTTGQQNKFPKNIFSSFDSSLQQQNFTFIQINMMQHIYTSHFRDCQHCHFISAHQRPGLMSTTNIYGDRCKKLDRFKQ